MQSHCLQADWQSGAAAVTRVDRQAGPVDEHKDELKET